MQQVWDDRGAGHLRFDGDGGKPGGKGALGYIAEHGIIHSALFERVRELEEAGLTELTCPAQVGTSSDFVGGRGRASRAMLSHGRISLVRDRG